MFRPRNQSLLAMAAAFSLSACVAAAPPPAPPVAGWQPVNAATGRLSDIPALTALAAAFPESASVQRRLLSAAVREKDAVLTAESLRRLEAMGYALRPQVFDALAPLIGSVEAEAARSRAEEMSRQVGVSVVSLTIPSTHRLVEGVAEDYRRDINRVYLSSIVDRRLVRMDDNRGIPVEGVDGGSLSGLAIDKPRGLLWVGSGVVDPTPSPETAFRGLIAVDLDQVKAVRRIAAPEGASLGDIAVSADGTVYGSDPMVGGLYRLRAGANSIETLVAPGTLRSPQGIAVHPGGRWLYVADYSYGIAMVDIATGIVSRLAAAQPMMLDGTDGLLWYDGGLIAIQNGTSPRRIVKIALNKSGRRATGLKVIEANHPEWGEPTIGQIVNGKDLVYVSDPQWDRYGPGGVVQGSEPLRPNRIRITPLSDEVALPPSR